MAPRRALIVEGRRRVGSGGVQLQIDARAVLPEALQRVLQARLSLLNVHDELEVVEQHPLAVDGSFSSHGLGARRQQLLLDVVHDGRHLTVIAAADHQEDIGDGELFRHIEGDDVAAQLVGGCLGSDASEFQCPLGCSQITCPCFCVGVSCAKPARGDAISREGGKASPTSGEMCWACRTSPGAHEVYSPRLATY